MRDSYGAGAHDVNFIIGVKDLAYLNRMLNRCLHKIFRNLIAFLYFFNKELYNWKYGVPPVATPS